MTIMQFSLVATHLTAVEADFPQPAGRGKLITGGQDESALR
jgi:hypothetical protein